ncbi:hypothetical protein PYCCODRAFT_898750 [Trametes coccinea BRFM310]|uniref:Uncharacterized protein n=1 Tax=Trametes coccinea (strain BRFM310) TaxID=1353009 RepID=A0A1Y2IE91_TRAC3|nr:hypothetical protein PYCCODRAFT_898750 [Trametes coccinea BRFM310]
MSLCPVVCCSITSCFPLDRSLWSCSSSSPLRILYMRVARICIGSVRELSKLARPLLARFRLGSALTSLQPAPFNLLKRPQTIIATLHAA